MHHGAAEGKSCSLAVLPFCGCNDVFTYFRKDSILLGFSYNVQMRHLFKQKGLDF